MENTRKRHKDGGIAQLARVLGSYPIGRRFESHYRYHKWPVGQEVKTPPFHGGITSSILVRVTKSKNNPNFLQHDRLFGLSFFIRFLGNALNLLQLYGNSFSKNKIYLIFSNVYLEKFHLIFFIIQKI